MKSSRVLLLCSALALPQLAMAGLADTSPQGLGIVNAFLMYCTTVDPRDAASFQQEWKSIVGDGSSHQLGVIEGGGEYKQAFESTTTELKKQPKSSVASTCATGAVEWNDGKAPVVSRDSIDSGKLRGERPSDRTRR